MNYELIGRKLVARYPFIAKELMDHSAFEDLEVIPDIFKRFHVLVPPARNKKESTEHRLLFIATIVMMYDPDYFDGFKRNILCNLRKVFAKVFDCDPTQISHNLKSVKNYHDVYPEFRYKVSYFYDTFVKEFKHAECKSKG